MPWPTAPSSVTALRDREAIRRELVDDSLAALSLVGASLPSAVVDVGSGNGSPGIPLALWYGAPVTLLESVARKASFLRELVRGGWRRAARWCCDALGAGLPAATGVTRYDLALARALARRRWPPSCACRWCGRAGA